MGLPTLRERPGRFDRLPMGVAVVHRFGCGVSDVGRKRARNEDAFLVDDSLGLYVVADGMGGHRAGEVASREAIEALHGMVLREAYDLRILDDVAPAALSDQGPLPPALHRAQRVLEGAIQSATYFVYGLGQSDPEQRGMGTTISALLLRGHYALSGQVGDSRIYRIRGREVTQLTEDHTLIAWQLKKGLISEEEARRSRQKNVITRAVGSREYVHVDLRCYPLLPEDRFLLCSDGLYEHLQTHELADLAEDNPELAARRAIELANQRGGSDNITAIFVATGDPALARHESSPP